jgi:hypothetical protein
VENVERGEKQAVDATRAALDPLSLAVEAIRFPDDMLVLRVAMGEARYYLAPVWAGEGYPSDVARAIAGYTPKDRRNLVPVVVARRLSRGGRQAAEDHGAGWVDLDGNARIVAPPGLLVLREAAPAPAPAPTRRWTESALAVAEFLLSHRVATCSDAVPAVSAFALDWSPSQVSKVLAFFDDEGWTAKGSGDRGPTARRTLVDPAGLLSAWAGRHAERRVESHGYSVAARDLRSYAWRLGNVLEPWTWCVTGWFALDVYAPYASDVPVLDVYVDDDALARAVMTFAADEWRPVERGARIRLLRAERHVLTFATEEEPPLASPVRVYADLLAIGGRGEDAAAYLREARLGF